MHSCLEPFVRPSVGDGCVLAPLRSDRLVVDRQYRDVELRSGLQAIMEVCRYWVVIHVHWQCPGVFYFMSRLQYKGQVFFLIATHHFLAIRVGGFRKCLALLLAGELTIDICVCVFVHMCALDHVQDCFGVGLHVLPQMCEAASMVLAGTWPLPGWLYHKDRPRVTARSK